MGEAAADIVTCPGGIGISTEIDGDWEECLTLSDAESCPIDDGEMMMMETEDEVEVAAVTTPTEATMMMDGNETQSSADEASMDKDMDDRVAPR